jgi:hypothetical protein
MLVEAGDEQGFSTLGSAIELNQSATGVLLWVRLRHGKASRVKARRVSCGYSTGNRRASAEEERRKMAPHRREHHDGVHAEGGACYKILVKGKIVISKQVKFFEVTKSTGSRTMQSRWTQKQQMNWWLEAQWMRLLPVARRTRWVLGAMDAPGVQGTMDAPFRGIRRCGSAWSQLEARWTRLLKTQGQMDAPAHGSWARSTRLLMELEAHWVRLVMGLEAQWTRACQARGRGGRLRMELEARWTRLLMGTGGAVHAPTTDWGRIGCATEWRRDGRAWGCGNTVCRIDRSVHASKWCDSIRLRMPCQLATDV